MNELAQFQIFLAQNGIMGYSLSDLQYLLGVAKRCARVAGIPVAGATGVALSGVGAVTIPMVGAVPGWVVGTLAGFVGGTSMCVIAQGSMKPALDQLLENNPQ